MMLLLLFTDDVCVVVLGGDFWRAWYWPDRYLPWRLGLAAGAYQCLLQRSYRYACDWIPLIKFNWPADYIDADKNKNKTKG